MNIKDYQYFQKLSELKNFSETAKFFKVSQPTITYSLKRLEDSYDISLVDRKSYANSLSLTPAGKQVLLHINRILLENNLITADVERFKREKIVMGFPPIITNYLVPKVFDQLKRIGLLNSFIPVSAGSRELLSKLKNGKLDMSFLGTTVLPEESHLDYQIIKKHQFKFIASEKRNTSNINTIEELFDEDFISLDESSVHKQVLQSLKERYNVYPYMSFQTADYKLMLNLVQADKGVSFVTETAIEGVPGIKEIKLDGIELPPFYILFVYRHNMIGSKMLKELTDIFKNI